MGKKKNTKNGDQSKANNRIFIFWGGGVCALMFLHLAMAVVHIAQDHLQMLSISCPQLTTLNNLNYVELCETRFA